MKQILLLFSTLFFLNVHAQETRALWVSRWDYNSPQDIDTIATRAATLGFNTLLFQVRGNATVTYPSNLEPWDTTLSDTTWNPLQKAIDAAHANSLQFHAWINVFPGWRGEEPPDDRSHLFYTHPAWFMYDLYGRPQTLNGHYMWLAPTIPFVLQHNLDVCEEIFTNYDIDGLHLDYIRFPGVNYSYDPISLSVFEKKFEALPSERPDSWDYWRRQSITIFLQLLSQKIKSQKPRLILSAAVVSEPYRAKHLYFQDSYAWLSHGYVDVI